MSIRVRLSFDELVQGYGKKMWFLFSTASCRLVADLEHLIQRKFDLQRNSSVNLYNDGFLLPAQEKIELVRDGDIIRVEQQGNLYGEKGDTSWGEDKDTKPPKTKKQKFDREPQRRTNTQLNHWKEKTDQFAKHSTYLGKKHTNKTGSVDGKPCKKYSKAIKKGETTPGRNGSKSERTSSSSDTSDTTWASYLESISGSSSESSSESSMESSTATASSSSTVEEEVVRKKRKAGKYNVHRENFGNGLEQNVTPGYISSLSSSSRSSSTLSSSALTHSSLLSSSTTDYSIKGRLQDPRSYNNNNVSFLLSPSSSLMSSSTYLSSTEDFSDDNGGSNTNVERKAIPKRSKVKAKVTSTTRSLCSSDVQDNMTSDQPQTQNKKGKDGLNANTKEKSLHKNKKARPKIEIDSSTSALSAKGQVETKKNQSKKQNPKREDDLNAKMKEKSLHKNKKSRPKINSSASARSDEGQVETAKNQSKTQNQEREDDLNAKMKEKSLHKNKKSRPMINSSASARSDEGQVETEKNQSKTQNDLIAKTQAVKSLPKNIKTKAKNNSSTLALSVEEQVKTARNDQEPLVPKKVAQKLTNKSYTPVVVIRNKATSTLIKTINHSHIRFDSDEENEDISAQKHDAYNDGITATNAAANGINTTDVPNEEPNSTQAYPVKNSCTPVSEETKTFEHPSLGNGGINSNGKDRVENEATTKETAVDFSIFPSLLGPPRVGDRIAYKVLELSASYTPEMSDYKEGVAHGYDPVTNNVLLELTEQSLSKPLGDGNISTKFELIYENEDEENENPPPPVIVERKVSVAWTSMVDPRLITS